MISFIILKLFFFLSFLSLVSCQVYIFFPHCLLNHFLLMSSGCHLWSPLPCINSHPALRQLFQSVLFSQQLAILNINCFVSCGLAIKILIFFVRFFLCYQPRLYWMYLIKLTINLLWETQSSDIYIFRTPKFILNELIFKILLTVTVRSFRESHCIN